MAKTAYPCVQEEEGEGDDREAGELPPDDDDEQASEQHKRKHAPIVWDGRAAKVGWSPQVSASASTHCPTFSTSTMFGGSLSPISCLHANFRSS